jgi:cellulose biosynthesis protein BcsQ
LLTANGIVAAQGVIIPSLPSESDVWGIQLLHKTLNRVKSVGLNPDVELLGILVVQFDGRTREHNRILDQLNADGTTVLGTVPRSVKVQEAIKAQKPITEYDPKSKPTQAYLAATEKVSAWLAHKNEGEAFLRGLN